MSSTSDARAPRLTETPPAEDDQKRATRPNPAFVFGVALVAVSVLAWPEPARSVSGEGPAFAATVGVTAQNVPILSIKADPASGQCPPISASVDWRQVAEVGLLSVASTGSGSERLCTIVVDSITFLKAGTLRLPIQLDLGPSLGKQVAVFSVTVGPNRVSSAIDLLAQAMSVDARAARGLSVRPRALAQLGLSKVLLGRARVALAAAVRSQQLPKALMAVENDELAMAERKADALIRLLRLGPAPASAALVVEIGQLEHWTESALRLLLPLPH